MNWVAEQPDIKHSIRHMSSLNDRPARPCAPAAR
jgi:hypothetical protein